MFEHRNDFAELNTEQNRNESEGKSQMPFKIREFRSSFTGQAKKILEELTLEEKVYLMSGLRTMEEVRLSIQKKVNAHYNENPYRAGEMKRAKFQLCILRTEPRVLYVVEKNIPVFP